MLYEGGLTPKAGLEQQRIDGPSDPIGAALWFMPVEHAGNQICSIEEAGVVVDLGRRIVGGATWTDEHGTVWSLGFDDVLIVAPYNAQVYAIQERLRMRGSGRSIAFRVSRRWS